MAAQINLTSFTKDPVIRILFEARTPTQNKNILFYSLRFFFVVVVVVRPVLFPKWQSEFWVAFQRSGNIID